MTPQTRDAGLFSNPPQDDPEVDEESDQSAPVPSRRRAVTLLSAMALLMVAALAGATYRRNTGGSKHVDYIPHSHPAFVNYVGVHPGYILHDANAGLCDPEIVQKTCEVLNAETAEHHGNGIDSDTRYVHVSEIVESLSVSRTSVQDLFKNLGVVDADAGKYGVAVSCQELCERLVGSFPHGELCDRSDVSGYRLSPESAPVFDTDVSPETLEKIVFDMPQNKKEAFEETTRMAPVEDARQKIVKSAVTHADHPTALQKILLKRLTHVRLGYLKLKKDLITKFRIYPAQSSTVQVLAPEPGQQGRRLLDPHWLEKTLKNAGLAQAYVNTAILKLESRTAGSIVTKWFGNNAETPTRSQIKRVLNGLDQMLSNVEYIYPGPQCRANTYAYVFPDWPWNKNDNGQFKFYLCDVYMNSGQGAQIETLTHEGTHHTQMLADDMPFKGQTMYGRLTCENAAKSCGQGNADSCTAARTNADTFAYFINDANAPPAPPPAASGFANAHATAKKKWDELAATAPTTKAAMSVPLIILIVCCLCVCCLCGRKLLEKGEDYAEE